MIIEFKMNLLIFALLSITFAYEETSFMEEEREDECYYLKFSPDHSYCKPRNPQCKIYNAGLQPTEKNLIVKLHNEYRSKVAMGKETRARGGRLPPAADMIELVWDEELASIAQKWAEQCKFEHDCPRCRRVDKYAVGQNLIQLSVSWKFKMTQKAKEQRLTDSIKGFSADIKNFHKKLIIKYTDGVEWNQLTQMIWSKTRKVGCGKVYYRGRTMDHHLLVCNYAPIGNVIGARVYQPGDPCSACPANTCCGYECKDAVGSGALYEGLCKVVGNSTLRIENPDNSTQKVKVKVWKAE